MPNTSRDPHRVLSLKWRVLIGLSLVLVLINASFGVLAYLQSSQQFESQQSKNRLKQQLELDALITNGSRLMSGFGGFISHLIDNQSTAPTVTLEERLHTAFVRHGRSLELEWGISSIRFIDTNGQTTTSWPELDTPTPMESLVQQSQSSEYPISTVACRPLCKQFLAMPLLFRGKTQGALLLERSIADLLLEFKHLSGADIAVLTPANKSSQPAGKESRYIPSWQVAVPALTNPTTLFQLILARADAIELIGLRQAPSSFQYNGAWYEMMTLKTRSHRTDISFLVVNDITEQIERTQQAAKDSLVIGLVGLLTSELLLLLMLWAPTKRLQILVGSLPLLAENAFDRFHLNLNPLKKSRLLADDIDLLIQEVGVLANRLEKAQVEQREAQKNLLWLAERDPLTELYNRRYFQDKFEHVLNQAMRYQHTGAILYFDLDEFKFVNDLRGHQTGDLLLAQVAKKIFSIVRDSDLLARLGGDEFGLLMPEADAESAIAMANKLLAQFNILEMPGHRHNQKVSASIGIALFPEHGREVAELLSNADLAMYQAKERGRGRWHMYAPDEKARELLDSHATWRGKINHALENNFFELHYQPILDLETSQVIRYEALIRARFEDGLLVYPDSFIPIAERTGQIHKIDRWVVKRALSTLKENPELILSVNLSGGVIDDPDMLSWLREVLANKPGVGKRIIFELTETAAIANIEAAALLMHELQKLGCRFALDDFGSGFASYSYIKLLPVDFVKIDGAFIRNLDTNPDDRIFVKALTDVARGLGKQTIAEFVENEATLALLKQLGVDYAQGYHIGKPGTSCAIQ